MGPFNNTKIQKYGSNFEQGTKTYFKKVGITVTKLKLKVQIFHFSDKFSILKLFLRRMFYHLSQFFAYSPQESCSHLLNVAVTLIDENDWHMLLNFTCTTKKFNNCHNTNAQPST